jgi:RND superfamily putative drug exporter
MLTWWSTRVTAWRWQIIAGGLIFMVFAGVWGTGLFSRVVDGGFDDPHSESARAIQQLDDRIGRTDADVILLVTNPAKTVDDPSYAADVSRAVADFPTAGSADDQVVTTRTYWNTKSAAFVTADRHTTYAALTLRDPGDRRSVSVYDSLKSVLAQRGYAAQIGGSAVVNDDISARVKADIGRAETISMPILLVLLAVIFGSLVSASLPLLIGGISILGAFTALRVIALFTDVSVFAINIVTIMGLGLAIDYGLFMVGRFREELAAGHDPVQATRRTVQTAGRTVLVSAITVAVALAGLTLFPQTFLRSMGFGGMSAVLIAAIVALAVLPAVLVTLGTRVDKFPLRRRRIKATNHPTNHPTSGSTNRPGNAADSEGFWFRLAHSVMRRPVLYLAASAIVLVVLALPFLNVRFGGIDERMLPTSSQARLVSHRLQTEFPSNGSSPIIADVELRASVDSSMGQQALVGYVNAVKGLPGATNVTVLATKGTTARLDINYHGESLDPQAKSLVNSIRALPHTPGVAVVLIGGNTAQLLDRLNSVGSILPWMGLLVCLATFVLLFFAFGSILLPLKAILLNILSLGASFGVVTWIFQDGHLSGLLNFTSTGTLEATQPILVLAIVFGLSMDYEVFLLSRVREQYDLTGDNRTAVATGLQRTGGIITSAALLIIVVIAAFSASSITFIKLIGVAMGTSIVIDALLVRMIVVPAAMRLLGDANWWAPRSLRGLYARFGIREEAPEAGSIDDFEDHMSTIPIVLDGIDHVRVDSGRRRQ